jgi:hypothetical protein
MSAVFAGDIVQIDPSLDVFGGCMLVVTEVREWGVQGYVQSAGVPGQQYMRVNWAEFKDTGGVAHWVIGTGDQQ